MSNQTDKRVLVAGGAGFLGSHLCERLLSEGATVICVDNFYTGTRENIAHLMGNPRFLLVEHDITVPLFHKVDEIYNLACPASPIHYQSDPIFTTKTSVIGTMNLLGMAKNCNAKIMQASTSEVYGDPLVHPQPESYWGHVNPNGIRSCYDEGKRCAESLCFDYRRRHAMDVKVVRIFNTYGPRMRLDDGRVVSNFINQALNDEPITIYGDGSQTRSFCYVDDLIEGFVRMMATPPEVCGPINLGNPVEFTIRELAEHVLAITESNSSLIEQPLPADDPQRRRPDISVAQEILGWEPQIPLATGLGPTMQYFDKRPSGSTAGSQSSESIQNRARVRAGGGGSKTSKVLVTGGAGYVGSHACKMLAAAGHVPVTIDNLVHGHRKSVRWGPFIEGDLADRHLLMRTLQEHEIDTVMHFAAYAYVGESMEDPGRYFRNNVSNTINLLDAMVETGVSRLVFSSTCATYGMPEHLPIGEDHPQHPINPYGESKLSIERAIHWYGVAHGIRSCSLRYFNAAGADPDGEIGENHDPETHLIPLVIQTAFGLRPEVRIFGTDYETADGSAVRDYIHVADLAAAHRQALEYLVAGGASRCLNLGTGAGHSVKEIIAAVERITGRSVNAVAAARRAGDPAVLVAAPGAAAEVLDWAPQYSDLDTIISTAAEWLRRQIVDHSASDAHSAVA